MELYGDVEYLKGVGPKAKELLNKCGIFTIMDLLLYFPREYENVSVNKKLSQINQDEKFLIYCEVKEVKKDIRTKTGKILSKIIFNDGDEDFTCNWFNQPYIKNKIEIGKFYTIMGKAKFENNNYVINNPIFINNETNKERGIVPIYPLKFSLTNTFLVKCLTRVLEEIYINENLPQRLIDKYKLCSMDYAIKNIHSPKNNESLKAAIRRLKFQELFTYSLKILMLKNFVSEKKYGNSLKISKELKLLSERLPFKLTNAQSRVVKEIILDQKSDRSMNRLVQGDVGSGKTIVALIAIFNSVMNGFQASLMAPTEILANQHYNEFKGLLEGFPINIELLVGSTKLKEKEIIKNKVKDGEVNILIGTHALIEEDVIFKNLGLIVTDEQHRFGVMQRNRLYSKGNNSDVLVMTATPIPRTLSLYLYGDLEVSVIDELPPGRKKIDTKCIKKESREEAYEFALKNIIEGRQIYVVCPYVEDNEEEIESVEKLYFDLKEKYFKNIEISMLHGRMKPKEKDEIMNSFKKGDIKLIISTTVIEVGINVPNANLMIIENAERFGLAQLHQLRGRVGRGEHKSYCILITNAKSKNTEKRMKIMEKSNDGFFIAEEDLKLRGGGEIFGTRQSGEDGLMISDVIADINILKCANEEAKYLMKSEDKDDIIFKKEIIQILSSKSKYICFN